jgi:hypothetical protein
MLSAPPHNRNEPILHDAASHTFHRQVSEAAIAQ